MPEGAPIKARLGKNYCILCTGDGAISVEFTRLQKSLEIPYGDMRCVQTWDDRLLINASGKEPVLYVFRLAGAKKMYDTIRSRLGAK